MSEQVKVFIGTRKSGFIFSSDAARKKWQVSDIHSKRWTKVHLENST